MSDTVNTTLMTWKIVVEFIITEPAKALGTAEEEAQNIADAWLDAVGFPANVMIQAVGSDMRILELRPNG